MGHDIIELNLMSRISDIFKRPSIDPTLAQGFAVARPEPLKLTSAVYFPKGTEPTNLYQGYRDLSSREIDLDLSSIGIAVHRQNLMDVYTRLTDLLGDEVSVALRRRQKPKQHEILMREGIDLSVLQSALFDHEELIVDDGLTSLSVIGLDETRVALNDGKTIFIASRDLSRFTKVLKDYSIPQIPNMTFIEFLEPEVCSIPDSDSKYNSLVTTLGAEAEPEPEPFDDGLAGSAY